MYLNIFKNGVIGFKQNSSYVRPLFCKVHFLSQRKKIGRSEKGIKYMKSFIAKWVISILVHLRYLRFKLLKYKQNNTKMCNTFVHNFKIYLYIMRKVSLERHVLFCTIRWCPYFKKKNQKCRLTRFAMKLFTSKAKQ